MPFVKRDANGTIVAMFREQSEDALEYLRPDHPDLQDFLPDADSFPEDPLAQRKQELTETDFALIRAIESVGYKASLAGAGS